MNGDAMQPLDADALEVRGQPVEVLTGDAGSPGRLNVVVNWFEELRLRLDAEVVVLKRSASSRHYTSDGTR